MNIVYQSETGECGLACVAMLADHFNTNVTLEDLRDRVGSSSKGASVEHLRSAAAEAGMTCRTGSADLQDVLDATEPLILHWEFKHFVVLAPRSKGILDKRHLILDPALGPRRLTRNEISEGFTGVVIQSERIWSFVPPQRKPETGLVQMVLQARGLLRSIASLVMISLAIQVISLTIPMFAQLSIDRIAPSGTTELLTLLACGFVALAVAEAALSWSRSSLLNRTSRDLQVQLSANVFQHMMNLPAAWFERRHLGDVISRHTSIGPLTSTLTRGVLSPIVDAITIVTVLCLLLFYSTYLTAVVMVFVTLEVMLKFAFLRALRIANANSITAAAVEQTQMAEIVRSIISIKVLGIENCLFSRWRDKKSTVISRQLKLEQLNAAFDSFKLFLQASAFITFVYVAATLISEGTLTTGMFVAITAYRTQLGGAVSHFIEGVAAFNLSGVHTTRINEVTGSKIEYQGNRSEALDQTIPSIEFRDVSYRYSSSDKWTLSGVSFFLPAGALALVIGESGSGKSTLLKIAAGLVDPSEGVVLINGVPLNEYGKINLRQNLGAVLQADNLFSGSLKDNISCMNGAMPDEEILEAITKARIQKDLAGFPMGLLTPVGDMGSALSGGQRQRILLARAFARRPSVFVGDEITASVEERLHEEICSEIERMPATRLIATHRQWPNPQPTLSVKNGRAHWLGGPPLWATSADPVVR